jgi:hypothetical protein
MMKLQEGKEVCQLSVLVPAFCLSGQIHWNFLQKRKSAFYSNFESCMPDEQKSRLGLSETGFIFMVAS